mmetsp:Transcript_12085/g.34239  ORF Transcript_12085/g.34239 Transcript_12085/m.34239 type:complete len:219 (-) Transcript_12085:65-721(-)
MMRLDTPLVVGESAILDHLRLHHIVCIQRLAVQLGGKPGDDILRFPNLFDRDIGVVPNVHEPQHRRDHDQKATLLRVLKAEVNLGAAQIGNAHRLFVPPRTHLERVPRNLRPPHPVPARLPLWARVSGIPVLIWPREPWDPSGREPLDRLGPGQRERPEGEGQGSEDRGPPVHRAAVDALDGLGGLDGLLLVACGDGSRIRPLPLPSREGRCDPARGM